MNKGMGAIPSPKDVRNFVATSSVSSEDFPESFELELTDVKDQGRVGSCVAHSLATIVEYFDKVQGDNVGRMSTGYIYGIRSNGYSGTGMIMSWACKDLRKYGICSYKKFTENIEVPDAITLSKDRLFDLYPEAYLNRVSSYFELNNNSAIKACLMSGSPVLFSIEWYDDITVDKEGVLHSNQVSSGSYHAMVIYGWDERGWKIQNSWGTDWGINGRGILPYSFPRRETWGFTDTYSENLRNLEISKYQSSIALLNQELLAKQTELTNLTTEYHASVTRYQDIVEELEVKKLAIKELEESIRDNEAQKTETEARCNALLEVIQQLRKELNENKSDSGLSAEELEARIALKEQELAYLLDEKDQMIALIQELNIELRKERENKSKLDCDEEEHVRLQKLYETTLDELELTKAELAKQLEEKSALEKQLLDVKQPYSSPLGTAIAKVINCLLNLFTKNK